MRRSYVAADILAVIQACFTTAIGDRCREYRFAQTRGIPPADCNSVSASWMDRDVSSFGDCDPGEGVQSCGEWNATHGLRIALTRVCMGPDQQPAFAWELEDAEAQCFMDDLDLLEECIQCTDWTEVKNTNSLYSLRYDGTTLDIESTGGGYSAYIELTLVAAECCTPPEPVEP